jgi:hypothetical protein
MIVFSFFTPPEIYLLPQARIARVGCSNRTLQTGFRVPPEYKFYTYTSSP